MIYNLRMGKGRNSEIEDIHNAARSGDLQKLQSICSSNPLAINSRDKHSRTPYPFYFIIIVIDFVWMQEQCRKPKETLKENME